MNHISSKITQEQISQFQKNLVEKKNTLIQEEITLLSVLLWQYFSTHHQNESVFIDSMPEDGNILTNITIIDKVNEEDDYVLLSEIVGENFTDEALNLIGQKIYDKENFEFDNTMEGRIEMLSFLMGRINAYEWLKQDNIEFFNDEIAKLSNHNIKN